MDDKKFTKIIALIAAVGMLTSAALVGYTAYLRSHCSIIAYIANEEG